MQHLTLADEIVVLMLNDADGEIRENLASIARVAVAGGLLMELALQERIDTDLESLFIVDPSPTGDTLLDATLQEIGDEPVQQPSAWWIDQLATRHENLVGRILGRLVAAGILREEERHFLWVFARRAYPSTTGVEEREAKARLMDVLFKDEVPDPRDTLLLGLAKATGVLAAILTDEELYKAGPRIEEVVALEEIGRSVGVVSNQVWEAMAAIMAAYPH
jgi:Golgi phosphoprotein 3